MDYKELYDIILEYLATYTNDLNKLKPELRKGIRRFYYRKLDGSLRTATGTLDFTQIPSSQWPKGIRKSSPKVFTYYDMDRKDWRCFVRPNFIGITIY